MLLLFFRYLTKRFVKTSIYINLKNKIKENTSNIEKEYNIIAFSLNKILYFSSTITKSITQREFKMCFFLYLDSRHIPTVNIKPCHISALTITNNDN